MSFLPSSHWLRHPSYWIEKTQVACQLVAPDPLVAPHVGAAPRGLDTERDGIHLFPEFQYILAAKQPVLDSTPLYVWWGAALWFQATKKTPQAIRRELVRVREVTALVTIGGCALMRATSLLLI